MTDLSQADLIAALEPFGFNIPTDAVGLIDISMDQTGFRALATILTSLKAGEVVLVPVEPDFDMIQAGEEAAFEYCHSEAGEEERRQSGPEPWWPSPARAYRAMIRAHQGGAS